MRNNYQCNALFFVVEKVRSEPLIHLIWEQKAPLFVGESVVIYCRVLTKDPKTKYRWYYTKILDENNLGALIDRRRYKQPPYIIADETTLANVWFRLRLENLTIDQSGIYWCQAENAVGNGSRHINLTVTYRPIIPTTGMTCSSNMFLQRMLQVLKWHSLRSIRKRGRKVLRLPRKPR